MHVGKQGSGESEKSERGMYVHVGKQGRGERTLENMVHCYTVNKATRCVIGLGDPRGRAPLVM